MTSTALPRVPVPEPSTFQAKIPTPEKLKYVVFWRRTIWLKKVVWLRDQPEYLVYEQLVPPQPVMPKLVRNVSPMIPEAFRPMFRGEEEGSTVQLPDDWELWSPP